MKKIFEKHGMVNCISTILDVIGIILILIAIPVSNTTAEVVLRLTGILMVIVGTFGILAKSIKAKVTKLGFIGTILIVLSFILIAIAAFVDETEYVNPNITLKLIGMLSFVVGGFMLSLTAKEHNIIKSLLVLAFAVIIFSWLVPYGYFSGSDFYNYGMNRIGVMDISIALYNAMYYSIDKIIYLIVLGGFYGVLSNISGYQKLVDKLASKFAKQPILVAVIMTVVLFIFTSFFSQTAMVLLFIPFFISILLHMNIDKLTAFAITFGSVLVGILGATYGTEAITMFNYYVGLDIETGLNYRFIVASVALVLYCFFITMRLKKILSNTKKTTKNSDIEDDPFKVEISRKKVSVVPVAIVLAILSIIIILCYVAWETNFGITIFSEFHDWLTGLAPVEDFYIMSYILGSSATEFGNYTYVFALCSVLILAAGLIAYLYRMKFNEFIEAFYTGIRRMFKPICYIIAVYLVFGLCYNAPFIAYISNWMFNLVEGFNPFITSIMAFITSIFHNDLGYTSFVVGSYLTNVFADNLDLVHVIYTSMYGIVQIFMPTSVMLVIGLSLMKLDYKSWFKYIWLFVVGMIIILLVLFIVLSYAGTTV